MNRKLTLRREVLSVLDDGDLRAIAGGETVPVTWFSCLTFVSCNPVHCVTRYVSLMLADCNPADSIKC